MGQHRLTPPLATHLHADDGVDEEEHGNQQADVGQGLQHAAHMSVSAI